MKRNLSSLNAQHVAGLGKLTAIKAEAADLRARLAAAEAREARLVGALAEVCRDLRLGFVVCERCSHENPTADLDCCAPAQAALTTDGSALAQAIEGVVNGWFVGCDIANDEMDDLMAALRAAWRGA